MLAKALIAVPLAENAASARGFAQLDEHLTTSPSLDGVIVAHAPTRDAACAFGAHVARRVAARGAQALFVRAQAGAPLWQEIGAKLGVTALDTDVARCADRIAAAARAKHTAIICELPAIGTWDRLVAAELAATSKTAPGQPSLLLTFVTHDDAHASEPPQDVAGAYFHLSARLAEDEKRCWLGALADEANARVDSDDVTVLESWWAGVRATRARQEDGRGKLPAVAEPLLAALGLTRRSWPLAAALALGARGASDAVDALVACGAAQIDDGWLSLARAWEPVAAEAAGRASLEACVAVADALVRTWPTDPWAWARAGELRLRAGAADEADATHARALALLHNATARRELVGSWLRALEHAPRAAQLGLRLAAGERALAADEAEEAYTWAQSAAPFTPDASPQEAARVSLLLGQSAMALGDLVTAKVALDRARELAPNPNAADAIAVELSELAYVCGDVEAAKRHAEQALGSPDAGARLRARNVLGKVLLAQSKWDDADRHFAEDAWRAASVGDKTAEVRARLNRGIALLWKGHYDEARSIFESVDADGERLNDVRACAFAHNNLAVIAMWRHEYGSALRSFEHALRLRQRTSDRLKIVAILVNLAELRYKLGLFQHAETAIAFGRRTIAAGMPHDTAARFSIVAARIALSRGTTVEARREIARAVAEGEAAAHLEKVAGEAYRVAVRIALEDGDLARAREALTKASEMVESDVARAEVAYLKAALARGEGTLELPLAHEALVLAKSFGEEELLREAHVLLSQVHRAEGNHDVALAHVEQALALRDQVVAVLEGEVAAAFLARPDVAELTRLHAVISESLSMPTRMRAAAPAITDEAEELAVPRAQRASRGQAGAASRELVGDDPAIRGLLAAVKRVARADSTVLIHGESGTGKELVADALHQASNRASGPLVTVNCAALVETLLLSELFGHEKGAFTGAVARRRGRFELAEGGTLFLDEIGDISARTQVALLRVLQERTFERVGGTTAIRADVRIVCATHRDLKGMVERGEFREDLYYRLRGITLEVPPLRARMGDLPRLCDSLLARIATERNETAKVLAPAALDLLGRHRWPGNVRELENALRAASLFADGDVISAKDLVDNVEDLRPLGQRSSVVPPPPSSSTLPTVPELVALDDAAPAEDEERLSISPESELLEPLPADEAGATAIAYSCVRQGTVSLSDLKRQIERDCIARALAETKGNITRAAALLGMKRPRLSQLVKQYGLAAVSEGGS